MQLTVTGIGQQSYTEQNKTVAGFDVTIFATTIGDVSIADIETMTLTVTVFRVDGSTQVLGGNLYALLLGNNPGFYELTDIGGYKAGYVDLGGFVNLKNDDRMTVLLNVGATNTGQYVTISTVYGVGVEEYMPVVTVFPIDKTRSSASVAFGDNVNRIAVVQTTIDEFVVTNLAIRSSIWECNIGTSQMVSKMAEQWPRDPSSFTFCVYDDYPMDNVNCDIQILTTATGNCYVVAYSGVQTPPVVRRANATFAKIASRIAKKFKTNN